MAMPVEIVALKRPTIQTISLTTTDWTAVTVSAGTKSILIQCRTANDILLAFDVAGATYWTIKSGMSIVLDSSMIATTTTKTFWLKTASATKTVEVIEAT